MFEKSTTWKKTLTNILEELKKDQYEKMLEYLDEIPKSQKNTESRVEMAQTIIEYYGDDKAILKIKDIMNEIPRRDDKIQEQLRPFVEKLKEKRGKKRKSGTDPESEVDQDSPAAVCLTGPKKKTIDPDDDDDDNDDGDDDDDDIKTGDPENPQPEKQTRSVEMAEKQKTAGIMSFFMSTKPKKTEIPSWRTPIKNLKDNGSPNGKPVGGQVVQKSGLRSYEKENKVKKFFFYLGIVDETDCIKVMVYGKERYQKFEEGKLYLFRDIEMVVLYGEPLIKVYKHSKFSKTNKIEVAEDLKLQAQMMIYSRHPVCSVEKIQTLPEKTSVSVEGSVTEIKPMDQVKRNGTIQNTHEFQLKDETGSIWITLWRGNTQQLRGTSVGDLVTVTNLRTTRYYDIVSLNSTDFTRICKIQAAAIQNVTMEIVGVIKCGRKASELEVAINDQVNTFIIASSLLAEVLGIKLKDDFEDKVLEKISFYAEGEIKGNKIRNLKATEKM